MAATFAALDTSAPGAPAHAESPYHVGGRYIRDLGLAETQRRLDAERQADADSRRAAWEERLLTRAAGTLSSLMLGALERLAGARVAGVRLTGRGERLAFVVVLTPSIVARRGEYVA